ncbi:MAG: prepilin-type N-terminal cleavage/methylation domain-containing protein [Lachnospiraceae bacterium]|nr:prepilin-type N-terminal cleavage/methylation domain-containing protein [Lachnospiraceae bacterium]
MKKRNGLNIIRNDRGFTLIELIVAMAILGVVSLTIYTFMIQGSRFYGKQNADATIQTDAQLVANAISDLIIDCEVDIRYDNSLSSQANTTEKVLQIVNEDMAFIIFKQDTNVFYLEGTYDAAAGKYTYDSGSLTDSAELLGQNVTAFNVDLSRVGGKGSKENIVTYSMTYENYGRKYAGNYQVNLRNMVTVSADSITKKTKEADISMVSVTPSPVYVDVKGKDTPQFMTASTDFTAHSDATNVPNEDIFDWALTNAEGNSVSFLSFLTVTSKKQVTVQYLQTAAADVTSTAFVVAKSKIANKATGNKPEGKAEIRFKKVNDLAIASVSGVTSGAAQPKTTAVFQASVDSFNLSTEEKNCKWELYYQQGATVDESKWQLCTNANIGTGTMLGATYSSALGSNASLNYSVKVGSSATEKTHFQIRVTNAFDSEYTAKYNLDVYKNDGNGGNKHPSRGVEIDITQYFVDGLGTGNPFSWPNGKPSQILDINIRNYSNHDCESHYNHTYTFTGSSFTFQRSDDAFLKVYYTDEDTTSQKCYVYLDYGALRYTEGANALEYYDSPNILCNLLYYNVDGQLVIADGVGWRLTPVSLSAGTPAAGGVMLIPYGGYADMTATFNGYNISKKSQVGIYIYTDGKFMNLNANDYAMQDFNPYISADYTGSIGNRYVLIDKASARLYSKSVTVLPTSSIPVRITIDDMYQLAASYNKTSYMDRSAYEFEAYISNVDGENIYVAGPDVGQTDWNSTTLVFSGQKNAGSSTAPIWSAYTYKATIATTPGTDVTENADETMDKPKMTLQFNKVLTDSGDLSYYTMTYNGKTYYYNQTYKKWISMS